MLVIVLFFYAWLITAGQLSVLEAAGTVMVMGIAAGVVIDRVIDGTHSVQQDLAALLQSTAEPGRP